MNADLKKKKRTPIGYPRQIVEMYLRYELPERHITALCEFVDNSFGEAAGDATNVIIEWDRSKIVITDDGQGIADLNAMQILGESGSRLHAGDIGQFGFGSKIGQIYLAWKVEIETVREGRYHRHFIDWQEVRDSNKTPFAYEDQSKPAKLALGGIHQGTRITLRDRHRDRHWQAEPLAERLAQIYRPALEVQGKSVKLVHGQGAQKRVFEVRDFISRLPGATLQLDGAIRGKAFRLRAAAKDGLSIKQNGVHIAYAFRVMHTEKTLPTRHLPPQLYAEVILSADWKSSLAVNKSSLAHGHDELMAEVEKLLTPMIDDLESKAQEIEIKGLVLEIERETEDILDAVAKEAGESGDNGVGQRPRVEGSKSTTLPSDAEAGVPAAKDEGEHAIAERALRQRKTGVSVTLVDNMGNCVSTVSIADAHIRVSLNKDLLYVRLMHKDTAGLLGLIFHAILDECVSRPASRRMIPAFRKSVDAGETPMEAKQRVLYKFLMRHEAGMRH